MERTKQYQVIDEKFIKDLRKSVQAILKSLKDATCDWTLQISLNSVEPDKVKYCCMIHVPKEGVAPITWVCNSYGELAEALEKASKELNVDMVQVAWHENELKKIEAMKNYHEEAIKALADKHSAKAGDNKSSK